MQTSASEVLKERFFHSFISSKKRKHPGGKWLKTVRQASQETVVAVVLVVTLFVCSCTFLFLAYQRSLSEIKTVRQFLLEASSEVENKSQNLLLAKQILNPESLSWHQIPFYFKLSGSKINTLLEKKIAETARTICAPAMMRSVCEQLSSHLQAQRWEKLLEALHVYLMLTGKESFSSRVVSRWFLERREEFTSALTAPQKEIYSIISSIDAAMFETVSGKPDLYKAILLSLESPELGQSVYEFIASKFDNGKSVSAAVFASKQAATLFVGDLKSATLPHLFTKEGYRGFAREQKRLMNALSAMPSLKRDLDMEQVNASIESALDIYKENYEFAWQDLLAKLRFKKSTSFDLLLSQIKRSAVDLDCLFNLIERLERNLIIEDDLQVLGQAVAKIAPEKLSGHIPRKENLLNHKPMTKEEAAEHKEAIRKDLVELTKQVASIASSQNQRKTCYKIVSEQEELLQNSDTLARALPAPLDGIYLDLVSHVRATIESNAVAYVNHIWQSQVADYYSKHIANKYPFNKANYKTQVQLEHFTGFFGQEGKWQKFKQEYLDNLKSGYVLLNEARKVAKKFDAISAAWFGEGGQLSVAFGITNATISGQAHAVNLFLVGQKATFSRTNLGPNEFTWKKEAPELAKVEFLCKRNQNTENSGLTYVGPWSWYKLLSLDSLISPAGCEKAYRKISSSAGEIKFLVYFHDGFHPLASEDLVLPKNIVSATISLEGIYER